MDGYLLTQVVDNTLRITYHSTKFAIFADVCDYGKLKIVAEEESEVCRIYTVDRLGSMNGTEYKMNSPGGAYKQCIAQLL